MATESHRRHAALRLRLRVRQHLANGRLPVMQPGEIAAGYGSGRLCAACDDPITTTQVEYEVDHRPGGSRLRFHIGCHVVWRLECAQENLGIAAH
jgi:hypothetical protein